MSHNPVRCFFAAFLGSVAIGLPAALAGKIEVIYTEIPGDPTAAVPGAKDAAGNPVAADFIAHEDLAISHDGAQWALKGRTNQATTLDSILLLGSGKTGAAFCQDGQPFQGGVAGEQYDFFDTPIPAAWDETGRIAFSARAKGGVASVFEKVVVYSGGVHTIVAQMGDLAVGLTDLPPNPSGDERFGNSINSVAMLNDGNVAFSDTPIANCHSSRYPALFIGHNMFRQSGVSAIDGEIWDNFGLSDGGWTPDGAHWFAEGDTENANTAIDGILAVDDNIVIQEGSPVTAGGPVMADIFFTRMLSNGDWYSRGDDPSDNDWAVRNGVLLAKTGDAITPTENWSAIFSSFTGNHAGDWLLCGNTSSADPNADNVMAFNGHYVIAREGDPLDINGNGQFDDNAFLASFQPNDTHLTDDLRVYFLATLRNSAGTSIGDAFLRMCVYDPCDVNCDGTINLFDIQEFVDVLAGAPGCSGCAADTNNDGSINLFDIQGFVDCLAAP